MTRPSRSLLRKSVPGKEGGHNARAAAYCGGSQPAKPGLGSREGVKVALSRPSEFYRCCQLHTGHPLQSSRQVGWRYLSDTSVHSVWG